ncbi:MAG: RsmG family class I SAM-dependent methyltransferase [Pseudomonadota bacterium]
MDDHNANISRTLKKVFLDAGDRVPEGLDRLSGYVAELLLWNRRFHLTGMKTVEEIAEKGVYACARIADHLAGCRSVLDIGSGNGLPGLVLAALVPSSTMTLVEKSPVKASFLKTAAAKMDTGNVAVVTARAEEMVGSLAADAAMSMAVLRPAAWLELGRNFVEPGGRVLLLHAGRDPVPDDAANLDLVTTDVYTLPWSGHSRAISVYKKNS